MQGYFGFSTDLGEHPRRAGSGASNRCLGRVGRCLVGVTYYVSHSISLGGLEIGYPYLQPTLICKKAQSQKSRPPLPQLLSPQILAARGPPSAPWHGEWEEGGSPQLLHLNPLRTLTTARSARPAQFVVQDPAPPRGWSGWSAWSGWSVPLPQPHHHHHHPKMVPFHTTTRSTTTLS